MKVKVTFDDKGYVKSWCEQGNLQDSQEYEVEETLWNDFWYAFKLEDGQLVYDDTLRTNIEQQQQKLEEIRQLKQQLKDTDYKAIKYAEGWISAEDYMEILNQRKAWRDRINELESSESDG